MDRNGDLGIKQNSLRWIYLSRASVAILVIGLMIFLKLVREKRFNKAYVLTNNLKAGDEPASWSIVFYD